MEENKEATKPNVTLINLSLIFPVIKVGITNKERTRRDIIGLNIIKNPVVNISKLYMSLVIFAMNTVLQEGITILYTIY